uniref:BTB domain-containing protein n=1 Tax=Ditylenchus dipsaci TaxID=166011 RepID=A0A915EGV9_9BILA
MGSVLGKDEDLDSSSSSSTFIDPIGPSTSGYVSDGDDNAAKVFKLDTPRYVHQKLFLESKNSDVVINALGNTWRLHKVYLEQCEYFRALFQGNWSDSHENEYTLEVIDTNICFTGLNNVFASLYNNEIEIDREHIAGVVASAAMLNLTSVLTRCSDLLSSYLSEDNVLLCLKLADTYGFSEKLNEALEFMKRNLWRYCLNIQFLKKLSLYWCSKILSAASDTLCVKENEMDLYVAIRNWIYLQNFPEDTEINEKRCAISSVAMIMTGWNTSMCCGI